MCEIKNDTQTPIFPKYEKNPDIIPLNAYMLDVYRSPNEESEIIIPDDIPDIHPPKILAQSENKSIIVMDIILPIDNVAICTDDKVKSIMLMLIKIQTNSLGFNIDFF